MSIYYADTLADGKTTYYLIRLEADGSILPLQTKYLKHKMNERCSSNTVQRIAYTIAFYMNFLAEQELSVEDVVKMSYADQQKHFTDFLYWIKTGNHSDRLKCPSNNTCNSYLQTVFGFYEFLYLEYEQFGELKVLEDSDITYRSSAGIRFRKNVKSFKGYFPKEEHRGRTISRDKIEILLDACTNIRDKLLIILLAESGFRIGELLGIRYTEDIDYENHTLYVRYRDDNSNGVYAKNAEYRRAKVSDSTFELLELYIAENAQELQKTDYLFITLYGDTKGKPLTKKAVYSLLNTLKKKTGVEATPHMLRHYFANERRKAGWDITLISKALGHKHIATTECYLNIENDELEAATDKYYAGTKDLMNISKVI